MKSYRLFIALLVVSPVSAASSSPLLGTWRIWVPQASCAETYVFKSDGSLSYTSGKESGESRFTISETPSSSGYYKFTDESVRTNGEPDCLGRSLPVGDVATAFIWFTQANGAFLLCASETLDACMGPFNRVLSAP